MTKISAEQYFDKFASSYDETAQSSNVNAQHLNEAVKIFQRYNYHQGSILDIACGTGLLSELLSGDFTYTGIDISSEMLKCAASRGYKTIHKPIETALSEINTKSYDFIFCLSSLQNIKDATTAIDRMRQIARKTILISIDEVTDKHILNAPTSVYDHSKIEIKDAIEDYFIFGWTSPTTGIKIRSRMIYIEPQS